MIGEPRKSESPFRVLILGATGLLGKALVKNWRRDEILGLGSKDVDIRDSTQVRNLVDWCRPKWIVLAAAFADVDGCETNPEKAHEVNCQGAVNVAEAAREYGSRLLFISTDYIFDGSKSIPYEVNDPVCPLSVYGESKARAESALRAILPECMIVRTSWLFGAHGKCFPDTILHLATRKQQLNVVSDQRGCPTLNSDLAESIAQLVEANAEGTVHLTNAGECSWFEFAQEITRRAGFENLQVLPTSSKDFPRPALRPSYSVLSNDSAKKYGISMRSWKEALGDYLAERQGMRAMDARAVPSV